VVEITISFVSLNNAPMSDLDTEQQSTPNDEQKAANRARFELELEFVQSLANPFYLQSLAQQNILEQPAFINFLEYLLYWQEKDYARFIQYAIYPSTSANSGIHTVMHGISYPHALHHLELLQHARFRSEMKKDDYFREFLQQKQFDHWRTWCGS
jgi:mediator of RNA polymerase II transcription subunit 31